MFLFRTCRPSLFIWRQTSPASMTTPQKYQRAVTSTRSRRISACLLSMPLTRSCRVRLRWALSPGQDTPLPSSVHSGNSFWYAEWKSRDDNSDCDYTWEDNSSQSGCWCRFVSHWDILEATHRRHYQQQQVWSGITLRRLQRHRKGPQSDGQEHLCPAAGEKLSPLSFHQTYQTMIVSYDSSPFAFIGSKYWFMSLTSSCRHFLPSVLSYNIAVGSSSFPCRRSKFTSCFVDFFVFVCTNAVWSAVNNLHQIV